jgi:hypothetical protein
VVPTRSTVSTGKRQRPQHMYAKCLELFAYRLICTKLRRNKLYLCNSRDFNQLRNIFNAPYTGCGKLTSVLMHSLLSNSMEHSYS